MIHARAIHRNAIHHLHRLRVAEIDSLFALRHDDRVLAIRREVHVVRIVHMNGRALLAGRRDRSPSTGHPDPAPPKASSCPRREPRAAARAGRCDCPLATRSDPPLCKSWDRSHRRCRSSYSAHTRATDKNGCSRSPCRARRSVEIRWIGHRRHSGQCTRLCLPRRQRVPDSETDKRPTERPRHQHQRPQLA